MTGTEILITVLVFISILLFILGIYAYVLYRKGRWELGRRIKQLEEGRWYEKQINILHSMKDYFLKTIESMGNLLKPKGEDQVSYLRKQFLKAGIRNENAPIIFFGTKAFMAVLLVLVFSLVKLFSRMIMPTSQFILVSAILLVVGFYLPNLFLLVKISGRKEKIQKTRIQGLKKSSSPSWRKMTSARKN